jgi:uncharacterized Fe-S cluster-containing radical SAM superfamily protein
MLLLEWRKVLLHLASNIWPRTTQTIKTIATYLRGEGGVCHGHARDYLRINAENWWGGVQCSSDVQRSETTNTDKVGEDSVGRRAR